MKILLNRLLPGLVLFLLLDGSAIGQVRIATVDVGKVFTNYWKFKQASTTLDQRKADMGKSEKDLIDAWQKAKDEYQKLLADANDQVVSAAEREKRAKAAEDKLKEVKDAEDTVRQFDVQAKTTLADQVNRMRDSLVGEIRDVVNSRAKAGNFNLVLDTTPQASGLPVVLYQTGENDLTEAVLKQLNANAPIESPAPTAKKPESDAGKK